MTRSPGAHLGPRRRDDGNPHAMVDHIVEPPAPGAERDGGAADALGLEPGHEPAPRRGDDLDVRRRRQPRVVIDDARVAALMLDDLPQLLDARARVDRRRARAPRRPHRRAPLRRRRACAPPAAPTAPRGRPGRDPFSVSIDSIDLVRVPDLAAERRVHAGDERFGPHAGGAADRDERLGERAATPRASS